MIVIQALLSILYLLAAAVVVELTTVVAAVLVVLFIIQELPLVLILHTLLQLVKVVRVERVK